MNNSNWKFNGDIIREFETHIKKSVPNYDEGHKLIEKLSDFFVKNDSTIYEIGSSTGKLSYNLSKQHSQKNSANFTAIEIEEDMINYAKSKYQNQNLQFINEDIITYDLESSDMIVSYYTMQFIHPKFRQELFNKIYKSLNWGGAFIMFEKVRANDARFQDIITTLYTDFKLENGFSEKEIINKTKSLKGVLEPFSTQANFDMLHRAGFEDTISVMKYLNFEGFLAIK
jgi:tRNA (cmo5U34)-methyltransferase